MNEANEKPAVGNVAGKIPTVFQRTPDRRHVAPEITPGCEWVFMGQGVETRKFDGTCVRITHGWYDGPQIEVWMRREVGKGKTPPPYFHVISTDEVTGKTVGWEPYGQTGFAKFIEEAVDGKHTTELPEGTYELCGPKINGNPEGFDHHVLVRHGQEVLTGVPLSFSGLRDWLARHEFEGIVWHHPDGRMAKLKRRDFPVGDDDA